MESKGRRNRKSKAEIKEHEVIEDLLDESETEPPCIAKIHTYEIQEMEPDEIEEMKKQIESIKAVHFEEPKRRKNDKLVHEDVFYIKDKAFKIKTVDIKKQIKEALATIEDLIAIIYA